jgi:hypothetical protein
MSRGQVKNITGDSFFAWDGNVLVVNVLGKPAAARDAIGKPKGTQLKISVTAAPQHGRATDHMVRFLAPLFGVSVAAHVVLLAHAFKSLGAMASRPLFDGGAKYHVAFETYLAPQLLQVAV